MLELSERLVWKTTKSSMFNLDFNLAQLFFIYIFSRIFTEEVEKAKKLSTKLSLGIGIFQGVSNLFVNGMVLGVLYVGGQMLINNEINAGQMIAYLTATQMIQRSFTQLSILFGQAVRGMSSGTRVYEVRLIY